MRVMLKPSTERQDVGCGPAVGCGGLNQPSRKQTVWHVLTIRYIRKLLKRHGADALVGPMPPTNRLDDWSANLLLHGRARLVICISERLFLLTIASGLISTRLARVVIET